MALTMLASMPLLPGCAAGLSPLAAPPVPASLGFYLQAAKAGPAQREALWRAQRGGSESDAARLQRALLQSLPGHSGYDALQARRQLQKLSGRKRPPDVRQLASLRLYEMDTQQRQQETIAELQQRLDRIVAIERRLDRRYDAASDADSAGSVESPKPPTTP